MSQLVGHLAKKGGFTGRDSPGPSAVRSKANYYVSKLQEREYIVTRKVGRESEMSLTSEGVLVSGGLMEQDGS